jgi:hypothetical protein
LAGATNNRTIVLGNRDLTAFGIDRAVKSARRPGTCRIGHRQPASRRLSGRDLTDAACRVAPGAQHEQRGAAMTDRAPRRAG